MEAHKPQRDVVIDALKALMLGLACFNHLCRFGISGDATCAYFYNPFGWFNGAEGFVFLSGLFAAYGGDWRRRLLRLYLVHVALCAFMVGVSSKSLFSFLQLALFLRTENYLDILPLYLFLSLLIPFLRWSFARGYGRHALGVSAAVWLACQFRSPLAPADFYFSLPAWQFLFVLGFTCRGWTRRWAWALPLALLFTVLRYVPALEFFTLGREHLAPWGLVNFLCVAAAVHAYLPKRGGFLVDKLAVIGRGSLWVFAFNTALHFMLPILSLPVHGWKLALLLAAAQIAAAFLAESRELGRVALWSGVALLPILYLPDFGLAYRDGRWILIWLIGAFSLLHRRTLSVSRWHFLLFGFAVWQIASLAFAANIGLAWQAAATWVALALVATQKPLDSDQLRRALLPGVCLVVALTELRVFFDWRLVSEGSGLGALVGERNSASALLALCLPLVLFASGRRGYWLLGALMLHCILATRTRACWWMLILYAPFLWPRWRQLALALALLVLPTQLHWTTPHPYFDSLRTLASPHHGNGRVALWRVGLKMAREHWALGVGAGNYPALAREAIASSGEDPQKFAFLRPDLPLFQDCLQEFVETGLLGGLLFAALLGFGLWLAGRSREPALALGCLALVANGFLDSPLHRPETLFLFVVFLGAGLPRFEINNYRLPAAAAFALLLLTAFRFGGSLAIRHRDPVTAFQLWRWDSQWTEKEFAGMLAKDEGSAAAMLSARRQEWPGDPTTYLMSAVWESHLGHAAQARAELARASVQLPGGRPVWNATERFASAGARETASARPPTVLLYHAFFADGPSMQYREPVREIEDQLHALAEDGYRSLTLDEYRRALSGEWQAPARSVLITFDDWTPDHFDLARPLLNKYHLHGIFFVIADKVESETERAKLRTLLQEGHEIGSHGVHHFFLTQSPCDAPWKCCHEKQPCRLEQKHAEIFESKRLLEEITGRPVEAFAWPGNFYDEDLLKEATRAGYRLQFAVEKQTMEDGVLTNRAGFTLRPQEVFRTEIGGGCPLPAFRSALRDGRCCVESARKFYRYCLPQTP